MGSSEAQPFTENWLQCVCMWPHTRILYFIKHPHPHFVAVMHAIYTSIIYQNIIMTRIITHSCIYSHNHFHRSFETIICFPHNETINFHMPALATTVRHQNHRSAWNWWKAHHISHFKNWIYICRLHIECRRKKLRILLQFNC